MAEWFAVSRPCRGRRSTAWLTAALVSAACVAPASDHGGTNAANPGPATVASENGRTSGGGASRDDARTDTPSADRDRCTVQAVTDGDSFRCADGRRVRLLLLDAPEMSQTPFGTRSRDALRSRLPRGATAWLEYDVQQFDRYDRTLAYVWTERVGGELVNTAMAAEGWAVAVVFPPNVRRIDEVRRAVADARRARRGLWVDGRFTCEPIDHKRGRC